MISGGDTCLTIVGGGLSGCSLGLIAQGRGMKVRVFDRGNQNSSSRAAAGIINPVTGMRFSRSWRVDEFLPEVVQFYQKWEEIYGKKLWHPMPICRLFASPELRDGFFKRRSLEELAPYGASMIEPGEDVGPFRNNYGGIWLRGGGWVDVSQFLEVAREQISQKGEWNEEAVDMEALVKESDSWVVDCRGYQRDEKFWPKLPWKPAHGDILTIQSDNDIPDYILNRSKFILPLGGRKFRFGATYHWNVDSPNPTEEGRASLMQSFSDWVDLSDVQVVGQEAGIRPIIRDQKPLLGCHQEVLHLAIFNGMGSKGGLWAPALAETLLDHLLEGKMLDLELDVHRFSHNEK